MGDLHLISDHAELHVDLESATAGKEIADAFKQVKNQAFAAGEAVMKARADALGAELAAIKEGVSAYVAAARKAADAELDVQQELAVLKALSGRELLAALEAASMDLAPVLPGGSPDPLDDVNPLD